MFANGPKNKTEETMQSIVETLMEGFKVKAAFIVLLNDDEPNIVCASGGPSEMIRNLPSILREIADNAEETLRGKAEE